MHLFIGNLYLWGNISTYVTTYYFYEEYNAMGRKGTPTASIELAVSVLPISFCVQACINPIGAFLMKKIHVKIIMVTGVAIMLTSLYFATLMKTWWTFVFFYAVLFPIGIGMVYWTPIICAWEWFPDRKGLISGLVIGCFGFGAFIFGFVTKSIVNPENVEAKVPFDGTVTKDKLFPEELGNRVPHML